MGAKICWKFLVILVFAPTAQISAASNTPVGKISIDDIGFYHDRLDLDVDVGLPLSVEGSPLVRVRVGKLWARGSWFKSLALGLKTSPIYSWASLAETEILYLPNGLWGQFAGGVSNTAHAVLDISTGWSLFGVGASSLFRDKSEWLFYAKVRIPISIILLKFI